MTFLNEKQIGLKLVTETKKWGGGHSVEVRVTIVFRYAGSDGPSP